MTEFKTRTIEADALLEVTLNGEDMLLHIEFQSTNDPAIGERLLGYNFEAKREHKLPVHSCVLYLKNVGDVPESPLRWTLPNAREVLRFHYESVELGKLSAEAIRGHSRCRDIKALDSENEHGTVGRRGFPISLHNWQGRKEQLM